MRDAVVSIEEDVLHIAKEVIGTHLICLGLAIRGCPVFFIMMVGRWLSNTFLQNIRRQLEEFNHDVSKKMIKYRFHRHISNYYAPTVSHLDSRKRNHPDNAETWRNIGGNVSQQAILPAFSQFH
jgi:hypothetical protein